MPEPNEMTQDPTQADESLDSGQVYEEGSQEEQPFFSTKIGEEEIKFRNAQELEREFKDSYLRRADYQRKTQTLAEQRKEVEQRQKELEDQYKEFVRKKQTYDQWDQTLKSRPDLYNKLLQIGTNPGPETYGLKAQAYADEKIKSLEDKLNSILEERQYEKKNKELEDIYSEMAQVYPDFDRDAVHSRLEELTTGELRPLIQNLYYANKGSITPEQIEQTMLKNQQAKQRAKMMPSGGGQVSNKKAFKNLKEAKQAALAAYTD